MAKWVHVLAVVVAFLVNTAANSNALLITYVDRSAFNLANPGLPLEGFQNANTGTAPFTGPLNSTTNNASFSPGDILPGITFVDNPGPGSSGMFVAGPGQSSNPTTAIGQNSPSTDALDILLSPGVTAIAFDIFQNFGGGSQSGVTQLYPISVFGSSGLLGSFTASVPSGQAGFFGVSSTNPGEITRVSINLTTAFDVIDNVAFGGSASIPEPSTLLLLCTGLFGLAAVQRKRKGN